MEALSATAGLFNRVLRALGEEPLPENVYTTCPFCGRAGKFRLYADGTYHCFRPRCGAHGDICEYLVRRGLVGSRAEARARVEAVLGGLGGTERRRGRRQVIQLLHEQYLEQAERHREVLREFAERRGYDVELLRRQRVGYAPPGWRPDLPEQLWRLVYPGRHLMEGRLVFPLYDAEGNLEHFQGRAVSSEEPLRWLSTGQDGVTPTVRHYLYNVPLPAASVLYVCEGITDTLSLLQLGLAAVGTLGLQVPVQHRVWGQVRRLVACYDGDRDEVGEYKSWGQVVPQLIALQLRWPQLEVGCVEPPAPYGDINEWLCAGLTRERFLAYVRQAYRPLWQWALRLYGERWDKHGELLQLAQVQPALRVALAERLRLAGMDAVSYAMRVLGLE
jgi:hypothetical protein